MNRWFSDILFFLGICPPVSLKDGKQLSACQLSLSMYFRASELNVGLGPGLGCDFELGLQNEARLQLWFKVLTSNVAGNMLTVLFLLLILAASRVVVKYLFYSFYKEKQQFFCDGFYKSYSLFGLEFSKVELLLSEIYRSTYRCTDLWAGWLKASRFLREDRFPEN